MEKRRIITSISILKELRDEALKAAREGRFPGISDFSSIVEYALDRLLHPERYRTPVDLGVVEETVKEAMADG